MLFECLIVSGTDVEAHSNKEGQRVSQTYWSSGAEVKWKEQIAFHTLW